MGGVDPTEGMVEDQTYGMSDAGNASEPYENVDVPYEDVDVPFEDVDVPYEVPEPPVTGDPVVDEGVRRVAAAAAQPLDVQVGVYDGAHRALQDRLADVGD